MSVPSLDLRPVAKVIKSFGTKGEMLIRYSPRFNDEIDEMRPVFINFDELPVPFFIEKITPRGTDQALVKLEGIDNEAQINEISGRFIHIESDSFSEEPQSDPSLFIGYQLEDISGILIGAITEFYDYPGNPCFGITRTDSRADELLLPVHEDIIVSIDDNVKKITARIPDGLLGL